MMIDFTYNAKRRPAELFQLAGRWSGNLPNDYAMVEQKFDGYRAGYWRGLDGKPALWTRNGHGIQGVGHILHKLAVIERLAAEKLMFDGEFIVGGTLHATKAWHEREWKSGGEAGTLHLFDAMPEREWRDGGCEMPLIERKARLQALHDAADAEIADAWAWREGTRGKEPDAPPTSVVSHSIVAGVRGVQMLANEVWALGGEGVMVKDPTAAYIRGRNQAWLKVKRQGVK